VKGSLLSLYKGFLQAMGVEKGKLPRESIGIPVVPFRDSLGIPVEFPKENRDLQMKNTLFKVRSCGEP
jgi:hypothetical protein